MEALAEAPEGDEGLGGESTGRHLAEGLVVGPGGALTAEAAHQQVDTGAPVLAYAGDTAARARRQLTPPACGETGGRSALSHPPALSEWPGPRLL